MHETNSILFNGMARTKDSLNTKLFTLASDLGKQKADQSQYNWASQVAQNPPANAGDVGSIPESEKFPGEGNSNPLQYSCLGNPMDRGAWWISVHGVTRIKYD